MIRDILHVKIESPFWEEALKKAQESPEIPQWLTEAYIADLEKEFALLGDQTAFVCQALCQVVKTPELLLLAKTLYHILGKKKKFVEAFPAFALPKAPEGLSDTLGYDYIGLFPILAHVRPFARELAARGIESDIIYDTLTFFRDNIARCKEKFGKPCFSEAAFSIYHVFVYTDFLWIGRLRFEIIPTANRQMQAFADTNGKVCLLMCDARLHASGHVLSAIGCTNEDGAFDADFCETRDYYEGYAVNPESGLAETARTRLPKKDWKRIFQSGDAVLMVHIPYAGKLLKEDCDAAYQRARQVFSKSYPEYDFKGFITNTWLLCPALKTFLKKNANIVLFQEAYHIHPSKNKAEDVFLYVFGRSVTSADQVDFAQLPEDNTMRRGVKKLLLEGTYIHQFNGFIPF